jgi:hypothetical protein
MAGAFWLRKLRMTYVLPVAMVIVTVVLTAWGDQYVWLLLGDSARIPGPHVREHLFVVSMMLIWRGVNGPAYLLSIAGAYSHPILGFSLGELLYFAAVGFVWHRVGLGLDRWRGLLPLSSPQGGMREKAYAALSIACGAILLFLTSPQIPRFLPATSGGDRIVRPDAEIACILFLLWSILLIAVGIQKLRSIARLRKAAS